MSGRRRDVADDDALSVSCQRGPVQGPKESEVAEAATSPTARSAGIDAVPPGRARRAGEQAREIPRGEAGPGLREQRGGAGDRRRGDARAGHRRERRLAVAGVPGIGRLRSRCPAPQAAGRAARRSVSPREENDATRPAVGVRRRAVAADRGDHA